MGIIGGLYPAFFLSRFRPGKILKANQLSSAEGTSRLRAALVVIQFSISIGLIVSAAAVYSQTHFAKNMDLGFNKDHLVALSGIGRDTVQPVQDTLRQELTKLPGVISAGRSSDAPPQRNNNNTLVELPDASSDELMVIETMTADYDFFPTIEVAPVAGRLFSPDFHADVMPAGPEKVEGDIRAGAILNQRAVKRLGYASSKAAIGQTFRVRAGEKRKAEITVVGVAPDMHFRSIREGITPMIYFLGDDVGDFRVITVKVRPGAPSWTKTSTPCMGRRRSA
ncbi:MAG: ABC transporter permease [Sphingomonadales bacterium]